MPNKTTSTNSWSTRRRLIMLVSLLAMLGLWGVFLVQPAGLPITDALGKPVDRLTELLVLPMALGGVFGDGSQPFGVLDKLPLLAAALAWLGLAWWLGRGLVERLLVDENWLVRTALAALAGLAWLSTLTLLVGLCPQGLSNRWPLTVALLISGGLAWLARPPKPGQSAEEHRRARNRDRARRAGQAQPASGAQRLEPKDALGLWIVRIIPVLVCVLAVGYALAGVLPAWEFDVLEYHLQAPKEFFQAGQVHFVEHNVYANMPLGAEMHALAWMTLLGGEAGWWAGGLIGKSVISLVSLLAAAAVGGFIGKRYGSSCGWCAAGLLLANAGCIHVSGHGLIDMVLGAYLVASVITLSALRFEREAEAGWLAGGVFLLGTLAGAAAASKYTGLMFAVVPVAVWLAVWVGRHKARQLVPVLAVFGLALVGTCVPWLGKNWALTGNPVYPLASAVFDTPGLSPEQLERWQRVHRPQAEGSTPYGLTAWVVSVKRVLVASPYTNPSLIFLAGAACVAACGRRADGSEARWLAVCAGGVLWVLAVWWLGTHRIDRFWIPIVPLLALLAGYGLATLGQYDLTKLAGGVALLGIGYGTLQAFSGAAQNDRRFFVALDALEREHTGETPSGYLTPIAWINAHLGADQRVLCIGEAKAFDFRMGIVYATCFNTNPGEVWLETMDAVQQIAQLHRQGITHVLVHWSEIARYRSPGNYGFSDWPQPEDMESLVNRGVLRRVEIPFEPEFAELYEVVSDTES